MTSPNHYRLPSSFLPVDQRNISSVLQQNSFVEVRSALYYSSSHCSRIFNNLFLVFIVNLKYLCASVKIALVLLKEKTMNRSPIALVRSSPTRCPMGSSLLCTKEISQCSVAVNMHSTSATHYTDSNSKVKKPEIALKIIEESNIVCFDVDSTVIKEEGIDELADFCGKGSEVARVTKEAMGGSMTFQDALSVRLNIIKPNQSQVNDFLKRRPSSLTKGVKQFVHYLKSEGKQVFLISGGFDSLIEPVATELNIPMSNVFANKLCFDENGEYEKFDTTQPTSRSGGKSMAVSIIKERNPSSVITMIGDGITDLEAVPPANFFIGFGGNIVRSEVFQRALYYVNDFEQLWTKQVNSA